MDLVRLSGVVFLSVVCFGFSASGADQSQGLEGVWRAVAVLESGRSLPSENVKKLRAEFSGTKFTMRLEDRVLFETDFTMDETTDPKSIEMEYQGKPTLGIVSLDGDRLAICLSGSKTERPTEFASERESPNRMLIRLRRGEFEPGHPLWVIDADGNNLRQLDMPKTLACGSPDWSPDDKRIACDAWDLSRGEYYAQGRITIVPVDGGEVTDLGLGAMPSWSPDGKRIAFCRYSPVRGVWVMSIDGTKEKLIDRTGWGVDWSPVGNEIVYTCPSSGGDNLCVVDPDTEERRTLLGKETYRSIYWNMSWAPDGKSICFQGIRPDGTREVARVSSSGDADGFKVVYSTKTTPQYEAIRTILSWAGNADQILISMKGPEDRFRQIYMIDAEGEKPPKLLPGQDHAYDNGDMAWSTDGKRAAFVAWEPD